MNEEERLKKDIKFWKNEAKDNFQKGKLEEKERVRRIVNELDIKYPSQCSGTIGIKWNKEFKKEIDEVEKE